MQTLFRFRDLIAETLAEHRKLIGSSGYCWWGWWKRPTEDARAGVWEELAREIERCGEVEIGLFNSGTGEVFKATVVEIVRPVHDETVPSLAVGEEQHVPEYYRASPFSRAWLKLQSISNSPLPTFYGSFAYRKAPPLPKIDPRQLNRLVGKKIVDKDELAAMDTTIWQIAPAADGAPDDHFLAATLLVVEPLSAEPVALKSANILHLTDLHFCQKEGLQHVWGTRGRNPLHAAIAQSLKSTTVGGIIVTGDFTCIASADEFNRAADSLSALLGIFGLDASSLVLCPGNHDIPWTKPEGERFCATEDSLPDVAPEHAKANYIAFYKRLLRHEPNADLSLARRWVLPNGCVLDICALNSSTLEHGREYLSGLGQIGPAAFRTAAAALGWSDDDESLAFRIVALHHHVTATENREPHGGYYSGFGMAVDSKRLLREAAGHGVQMILHGHKHRAFFWREGVYELPEHTHSRYFRGHVAILGGGSAGSSEAEGRKNYFNLLRFSPDAVRVTLYRSEDATTFAAAAKWRASTIISNRRLALGDWDIDRTNDAS